MNGFVNPWFLLGLAGVAIPIIIHILTRDRVRKVAFSTLRFFVQGARVTLRRKRWAEMLIIALRVLVCALAALLFARPLLGHKRTGTGPVYPQATMLIADVSASMTRAGGAGALAAQIRKVVAALPTGAAAGLLACDQAVRELTPLDPNTRPVLAAADALAPGEGATDLPPALKQASEALRQVTAPRKEIVLISDLQRNGFDTYKGDWKLAPGVQLRTVELSASPDATDVGIVDAQFPQSLVRDNQPRAITARIVNRGRRDLQDVPVVLRLGERETERQSVRLPAGGSLTVRFWHVFDRVGDNPGEVRVLCDDVDPGGNRFFFNARVIPEIPVLLVSRTTAASGGALNFLQKALHPGVETPFTVKTVSAAALRPADVNAAAVLVLVDTATIDPACVAAATALLQRGGGLFFLPGDNVTPEAFWSAWSSVAPCRIRRVITRQSAQGIAEGELTMMDASHPVFEIFQRPHYGNFATVRFARYWDVSESQASRVLARFDDGRPAMLERAIGQGVALIWLSPPDPAWNNLPLRAIFLPLLHETIRQAAVRTESQTTFPVGQPPLIPQGFAAVNSAAWGTGFHTLTNAAGQALCFAINRPFVEAASLRLKPQELKAALERPDAPEGGGANQPAQAPDAHRRELWWWLAATLVVLLPAELWLANRTARH